MRCRGIRTNPYWMWVRCMILSSIRNQIEMLHSCDIYVTYEALLKGWFEPSCKIRATFERPGPKMATEVPRAVFRASRRSFIYLSKNVKPRWKRSYVGGHRTFLRMAPSKREEIHKDTQLWPILRQYPRTSNHNKSYGKSPFVQQRPGWFRLWYFERLSWAV